MPSGKIYLRMGDWQVKPMTKVIVRRNPTSKTPESLECKNQVARQGWNARLRGSPSVWHWETTPGILAHIPKVGCRIDLSEAAAAPCCLEVLSAGLEHLQSCGRS